MYDAMIRKDADALSAVLDDSFVLVHIIVMIFCLSRFFAGDISVRSFRNYACGNFVNDRVNALCA